MKIMTQKQGFIKRVLTHNRREKLLAVLCTVLVMLVALCFKQVSKVYTLKVNAKIAEDQIVVSGNIDSVEVKVSGTFFELRKVKTEDLVINFDFSSEKAGEISRSIGDKELPASFAPLDVKNISPEILTWVTEEKKAEIAPSDSAPVEESVKDATDQEPSQESVGTTPAETFQETSLPVKKETGEK